MLFRFTVYLNLKLVLVGFKCTSDLNLVLDQSYSVPHPCTVGCSNRFTVYLSLELMLFRFTVYFRLELILFRLTVYSTSTSAMNWYS